MDYQDDTLTNASRNRAASRKLFEQWNSSSGSTNSISNSLSSTASAVASSSNFPAQLFMYSPVQKQPQQQQQPPPPSASQTTAPTPATMSTTGGSLTNGGGSSSFDHNLQQQQHLLHRSPSGAQRKIRQKAQQQHQNHHHLHQQQMSNNISTSNGNGGIGVGGNHHHQQNQQQNGGAANGFSSSNVQQQTHQVHQAHQMPSYRHLIRENGYRSILGSSSEDGNGGGGGVELLLEDGGGMAASGALSVGQLIDRMNRLEPFSTNNNKSSQQQQLSAGSASVDNWLMNGGGSGGGSIDKMPTAFSAANPLELYQQQPMAFSKPTVQVHPLPVPPRHRSMSSVISSSTASSLSSSASSNNNMKPPIPPPLPPKKQSLMMAQFALANNKQRSMSVDEHSNGNKNGKIQEEEEEEKPSLTKALNNGGQWNSFPATPNGLLSNQNQLNSSPLPSTFSPSFSHSNNNSSDELTSNSFVFPPINNNKETVGQLQQELLQQQQTKSVVTEPAAGRGGEHQQPLKQQHSISKSGINGCCSLFFSPPPSLSSSPSLTSLQNSLLFALDNPDKHSWEQLQELEQRRLQSIDSLARKVAEREQDRALLCHDLEDVDQLRQALFSRLGHHSAARGLLGRLQCFLAEAERMAELDALLQCHAVRLMNNNGNKEAAKMATKARSGKSALLENADGDDNSRDRAKAEWARRLREQLNDLHSLRSALVARERLLDSEMAEELGDAEALHEWLFCKEQMAKLCAERRQLDERLRDVKKLLTALQQCCLLSSANGVSADDGGEADDKGEEDDDGVVGRK